MKKLLENKNIEDLKPVYLIESRSEKIIDEKIREIKNYFKNKIDTDSDFRLIDENDEVIISDLFNFLSIPSFFSLRKILVVKNIDKISKDVVRFISEYMKSNPGFKKNSILFLSCTDSKKISSMLPEISSFGELIKIDKAISEDMRKRLVEKNDLNNVRFTPHALTMFLENVADDPILFENEYEKILSNVYFDKTKIVSEEKVKALIHRSTESTVFDLVDCIGRKDFSKAVSIIPDILTGVSPNDSSVIIPIVTNLYRMFKTMLYIKSEKNGVQSAFGYLQKNINAKSYFLNIILKKYQIFEKKYSYDEIIRILGFLNEFDIEIKSKSNLPAKTYLGSLILNIQLIALQD